MTHATEQSALAVAQREAWDRAAFMLGRLAQSPRREIEARTLARLIAACAELDGLTQGAAYASWDAAQYNGETGLRRARVERLTNHIIEDATALLVALAGGY
jgi:hypothetical protein